jgi:hypothetical protein
LAVENEVNSKDAKAAEEPPAFEFVRHCR